MWRWCVAPPVLAEEVWSLLPSRMTDVINKWEWVAPQYRRLAMGSSHSVHILMTINLQVIGMALQSARLQWNHDDKEEDNDETSIFASCEGGESFFGCSDEEWVLRQQARKQQSMRKSGYTVDEWIRAVRTAKLSGR
jgi:hypothetical protein